MGFSAALHSRFATTHENRFWNKLVQKLNSHFGARKESFLIAGNFIVDGKQIDALVIKEDAIVVVDFKDYGGTLSISENGTWLISGTPINSGRKNPFIQLSDHKYGLLNALSRRLAPGYDNWVNLGHINAVALFHQDVEYDNDNLKDDLSPSASRWFSITDFSHICKTLDEITSSETLIRGENFFSLVAALGLEDVPVYELETGAVGSNHMDNHKVNETENVIVEAQVESNLVQTNVEQNFSDLYYSTARNLESIELLVIGQDPYPEGANGVAFCKSSLYGLYQEGCSGGIVVASLGYSRQRAFDSYKNPEVMFYDLLVSKGVCFANISNREFKKLSVQEVIDSTNQTRDFNLDLVKKAKKIVLLGKGKTRRYFKELYEGYEPSHVLIHPSFKNRQDFEDEWRDTWETNALQRILGEI